MASSSSPSPAKTMASGSVLLLHHRATVPKASFLRATGRGVSAWRSRNVGFSISSSNGTAVPPWTSDSEKGPAIMEIPLAMIRRPLMRTRANDPAKVQELMDSIRVIRLQVPIDVLEVDGIYYGSTYVPTWKLPVLSGDLDENGLHKHGYTYVDPSFSRAPDGPKHMCYCGDECKLGVSGFYETIMQRYWQCANYAYDPSPHDYQETMPHPLCDFKQWIDTERPEEGMKYLHKEKGLREMEEERETEDMRLRREERQR